MSRKTKGMSVYHRAIKVLQDPRKKRCRPGRNWDSRFELQTTSQDDRNSDWEKKQYKANPIDLSYDRSIRYMDSGQSEAKSPIFHAINRIERNSGPFFGKNVCSRPIKDWGTIKAVGICECSGQSIVSWLVRPRGVLY
jgi:hypothetical protein